jgi:hypothetical protein
MILITQPRVGTSHNEILALQMAAREMGWEVLSAPNGWRLDSELIESGQQGVPYGSQIFCEVIAQQMGWKLILNPFEWLATLKKPLVSRKIEFMTLGEAQNLKRTKFIKPADDKVFPAKVYKPKELQVHESVSLDTPTLVSSVVEFESEYRYFCTNEGPHTGSCYIYKGEIANPKNWEADIEEVTRFIDIAFFNKKLTTVPAVIDVGRMANGKLAIIETNQAHASGLYGCDPEQALKVMEQTCVLI